MIVIAVWVIFAIILNEYFINWLMLVLAIVLFCGRSRASRLHLYRYAGEGNGTGSR